MACCLICRTPARSICAITLCFLCPKPFSVQNLFRHDSALPCFANAWLFSYSGLMASQMGQDCSQQADGTSRVYVCPWEDPFLTSRSNRMDVLQIHEDERAHGGVPHSTLLLSCCALSFTGTVRRMMWPCCQNCIYGVCLPIVAVKHTVKTSLVPLPQEGHHQAVVVLLLGCYVTEDSFKCRGHMHYSASKHDLRLKSSSCCVKGIDLLLIVTARPNVSF